MNNKILIGFNIILLASVIVLFVLFYRHISNTTTTTTVQTINGKKTPTVVEEKDKEATPAYKIAYFEYDSIEENYTYYREVKKALISRENQIQGTLNRLRNAFTAKVKEYNEKGPSLSQSEQMAYQKELNDMQKNYSSKEQQLGQSFQEEQYRRILEVKNRIQTFLKTYAKQKGYSFVFATGGNADGDNIYYKDSSRNITKDLLRGLNAKKK